MRGEEDYFGLLKIDNMRLRNLLLIVVFSLVGITTNGQTLFPNPGKVFNDEVVPKVYIEIDPGDFSEMINTLENEDPFPATFIFDNGNDRDTVENIGLRLRGNTSLDAAKKSFKISFNAFEAGKKYKGLEKMNINGEHNDPSVIRSKISWDLCRQAGIPSSRSNHVELYINEDYFGLYINVEHIDEEFVQLRFGDEIGNLYKCTWPATLEYLGSNPDNYKFENNGRRAYELKTNTAEDNYSDIANFIDVLNNTSNAELSCELEKIFDVQNYLKIIAFDVLTANWDGPIFNKNNFYLYNNPQDGKIHYIPYDVDNSYGIRWFGEWTDRNIYSWSPSGEPRPIYTKIMANDQYRAQYTYYVEQFLDLYFNEDGFFDHIDELKNLIEGSITNDIYYPQDYGFTPSDFQNSYVQGLDVFHVPHGLKEYISLRHTSASNQIESTNEAPIITNIQQESGNANQDIFISAKIENDGNLTATVDYNFDGQDGQAVLFDDGLHNDQNAGDDIYGGTIPATDQAGILTYFISAIDDEMNSNRFPYCENIAIELFENSTPLYINELQSNNESTIVDEAGEFDDWLELYNAGNQALNLSDFFLSDNLGNLSKWQLPVETIDPGTFLLIWADDDLDQGIFHTNFKLNANGETLTLSNSSGDIIDQVSYSGQSNDEATGRLPNGTGIMQPVSPTPGASNIPFTSMEELIIPDFKIAPNPFSEILSISSEIEIIEIRLFNLLGQEVFNSKEFGTQINLHLAKLNAGIYLLQMKFEGGVIGTERVLKVKRF